MRRRTAHVRAMSKALMRPVASVARPAAKMSRRLQHDDDDDDATIAAAALRLSSLHPKPSPATLRCSIQRPAHLLC